MAFRFRLIPRNEDFYDQFSTLAAQLRVGAGKLEEMLAQEPIIWDKADEIKEVEHKCDHLKGGGGRGGGRGRRRGGGGWGLQWGVGGGGGG